MSAMMQPSQSCPLEPADLPLAPAYARLGAPFHQPVAATPLPEPRMVHFNAALAGDLGVDSEGGLEFLEILAGNQPWPGYASSASVYAGHQFGHWVPQLGDGRALLIAEVRSPAGERVELQLKGAGPTPYSRGLDGRAVLRSSIREYLGSEAMHALGVPTTRCLSLVASSQPVVRETVENAAVVCRTAASFVRFGQFEYFAGRGKTGPMARLADHMISEHFPHLQGRPDRYAAWLGEVVERTARLIAQWQLLGFCHGVMNTDNFSVLGLTLDYGPFGFMDRFRQYHVCNHSDYEGRYAYSAQPEIGRWNCERLLQAVSPLLAEKPEEAAAVGQDILRHYAPIYKHAVTQGWADKLGLRELREGDGRLVNEFLGLLQRSRGDFTRSFRLLSRIRADSDAPAKGVREAFADIKAFDAWVADYRARLRSEQNTDDEARAGRMNRVNPKYVLRNHLAQIAIDRAMLGDYSEVAKLTGLLRRPYDEQPDMEAYAAEPPDYMRNIEVSCSS
ncbi:protein adenylyltransferase SelO [Methylococcus mesophilus]|uniref:protein adenylyltransferase SelO n=1 Tax=Methylococcus mesophilus TaxID=2993564 RepID=UPI00224AFCEA|nr:YdiU family protein [Methylococcus mesophilus]UZR28265.1 YdiU family protein [Methylococcus mesophilus]